jgi:hypothetical protein
MHDILKNEYVFFNVKIKIKLFFIYRNSKDFDLEPDPLLLRVVYR